MSNTVDGYNGNQTDLILSQVLIVHSECSLGC
jgi:hypothetical protein